MYDAIIVGARCGGSATAMLLARLGHSVLVVDRAEFPSDVWSTHFIHAGGTALLERWGAIPRLKERGVPVFDHVMINIGGNKMSTADLFNSRTVCSPRRTDLDTVLRDLAVEAGAEVRMQTTVTDLLRGDDGRVVGVRLRDKDGNVAEETASVVVGADGRTSVVARAVEPAARDEHNIHGFGFYAYFDDFDYSSVSAAFFDGAFVFAFPTGPRSACVGTEIGLLHEQAIREETEATFFDKIGNDPDLCARAKAATRDGRWRTGELTEGFFRHAAGPGWALVGDAACTKDPLLGHGITDAFIGAELLAAAIHNDALDQYDEALFRYLGPIYEASRDAAVNLDVSADELFAAVTPAQMLSAEEAEMVMAGGPTLD